jgi:hypothetical protein
MQKIFRAKSVTSFLLIIALLIPLTAIAEPIYYTIDNATSGSLGTVTVSCSASGVNVSVSSTGSYLTEVPGAVTSVTVNGQTAPYPTTTDIVLPNGHLGRISFPTTSSVIIIDLMEGA